MVDLARGAAMAHVALAGVLAIGCARQPVTVAPREILAHVGELRRDGRAEVDVEPGGTRSLSMADRLPVEMSAPRLLGLLRGRRVRHYTVAELIAHCPDVAPFREDGYRRDPACLLLETPTDSIEVGHRLRPNWDLWKVAGGALLVSVVLGTAAGYVARCSAPDDGC